MKAPRRLAVARSANVWARWPASRKNRRYESSERVLPEQPPGDRGHDAQEGRLSNPALSGGEADGLVAKVASPQALETALAHVVVIEARRQSLDAPGQDIALDGMTGSRGRARPGHELPEHPAIQPSRLTPGPADDAGEVAEGHEPAREFAHRSATLECALQAHAVLGRGVVGKRNSRPAGVRLVQRRLRLLRQAAAEMPRQLPRVRHVGDVPSGEVKVSRREGAFPFRGHVAAGGPIGGRHEKPQGRQPADLPIDRGRRVGQEGPGDRTARPRLVEFREELDDERHRRDPAAAHELLETEPASSPVGDDVGASDETHPASLQARRFVPRGVASRPSCFSRRRRVCRAS